MPDIGAGLHAVAGAAPMDEAQIRPIMDDRDELMFTVPERSAPAERRSEQKPSGFQLGDPRLPSMAAPNRFYPGQHVFETRDVYGGVGGSRRIRGRRAYHAA